MHFQEEIEHTSQRIHTYSNGCLRVGQTNYQHSVLLQPAAACQPWRIIDPNEISLDSLTPLLTHTPEVILIGTGETGLFGAQALIGALYERKIGVEFMSTEAACRTYNLLLSENRRVAAALFIQPTT
jgi:uncharacterized protein